VKKKAAPPDRRVPLKELVPVNGKEREAVG